MMSKFLLLPVSLVLFAVGCKSADNANGTPAPSTAVVGFATVSPILTKSCGTCHTGDRAAEGIDVSSYAALMKGGKEGPVVTAGDSKNSALTQALRGLNGKKQMPMRAAPLPEEDIKKIEGWIDAGAKEG